MEDNKQPVEGQTVETETVEPVKTYTQEEVQKMIQDRLVREKKKYEGFGDLQKEVDELRKLKEETENAKLNEQEKLQKQLEKELTEKQSLSEQLQSLQQQVSKERLESNFKRIAEKNGIQYVDDALKLTDLTSVQVDEEGNYVGLEDLVKQLVETKPYLVVQKEAPKPIGGSSNPPQPAEKTGEQLVKEAEEKYRRTQSPNDYVALVTLKRKYGMYNR